MNHESADAATFCRGLARAAIAVVALIASPLAFAQPVPAEAPASAGDADTAETYRIGSGDTLNVFVWNHPELTVDVTVRPDGVISTPLVDSLRAAGKTPTLLARDMERALAEYVRAPRVSIIVRGFVGSLDSQIRVLGAAAKPQALPFRSGMTVLDVLISVGGLGPYAAGNRAHIVRMVGGKEQRLRVKLQNMVSDGDLRTNIPVLPGDVLVIPESRF